MAVHAQDLELKEVRVDAVDTKALLDQSEVNAIKSLVPDFEDSRMRDYLTLRGFNFSHEEGMKALFVTEGQFSLWLMVPEFKTWLQRDLRKLQRRFTSELLRAQFMRNAFLTMQIDSQVLAKRAFNPEELTPQEREEVKEASKRYTAQTLAAFERVTDDENEGREAGQYNFSIKVDTGATEVEVHAQKVVKARKLWQNFIQKDPEAMVIDGETGEVIDG